MRHRLKPPLCPSLLRRTEPPIFVEGVMSEMVFVLMVLAAPSGDIATVLKTIASTVKYVVLLNRRAVIAVEVM